MQFDTSGAVPKQQPADMASPIIAGHVFGRTEWSDLSPFVQGYVEALFAQFDRERPQDPNSPDRDFRFSDLAPETLARIMEDCANFSEAAHVSSAYAGKLFWKDRNWIAHLGVSLPFDNRYGDVLRTFPPLTVYLGDDGKVRFQ